ncbi:hypothetical protein PENSPDRAFT_660490 [Peniophora sp. CONT]|nr:hypothetical protein PENSPDRAFT_660490 [Peniophora sp. CONT]
MGRKERAKMLRQSLNLRILKPETLHDEAGLRLALEQLESVLDLAPVRVRAEGALTEALGQPGALPYLISVVPPKTLNTLAQTALSLFPTTQETWSETCTGWRILTSLIESAMFLPVETLDEHQRTLREMHQLVNTAPNALLALASAQADLDLPLYDPPPASAPADLDLPLYDPPPASAPADLEFSFDMKQTQRERKMARNRQRTPGSALDTDGLSGRSALDELGYAIPTSQAQAEEFAGRILTSCQAVLKRLLHFFRRDVLKDVIRSMYIPVVDSTHELELAEFVADLVLEDSSDALSDIYTDSDTLVDDHSSTTDSEYLDGNKSGSFFYDEGFGPWKLVLSPRARGDLRESERGDAHMYSIWVKKMRELSHGHFSEDNQKRFIDRGFLVPVFEAKMTRDTRLVYQIDLEPDTSTHTMRQVIYIYSFSTHRQVDKRLWNAISHKMEMTRKSERSNKWDHLSCRGRVYQKRCTYRGMQGGYGETIIPPGEWSLDDEEAIAPLKLPERARELNGREQPLSPPISAKRPKQLTIDLDAAQANTSPPRRTGRLGQPTYTASPTPAIDTSMFLVDTRFPVPASTTSYARCLP